MAIDYAVVKLVHVVAVTLSLCGFVARGLGSFAGAAWVDRRAARTVPHVVDTILLVAAVMLAWRLRLAPTASPWLMAKIVGLAVYIALGTMALRRGRPRSVRIAAWLAALATFAYIVSVAVTKDPHGFLQPLAGS